MRGLRHIAALLVLVWASVAMACEPLPDPGIWIDKKIRVAADCSFSEAGDHYENNLTGNKAINIGGGRIGQKVESYHACRTDERLIFVDCTTAQGVFVEGIVDPKNALDFGSGPSTSIAMIQRPRGPLRLTASTTVAEVVATAKRAGLSHTTDLAADLSGMKKRNRYNPFCGCAVFYPGSAGAKK